MIEMKVLHINTYDKGGGAETIAFTLFKHQPKATLLVKQKVYFSDEGILEFKNNFVDKAILLFDKIIWKFGFRKGIKTYLHAGDEANLTYRKLKKLRAYREADIIHLHNIHGGYFDLSSLRKIAAEKFIVWTLHDMWAFTGGEAYTNFRRNKNQNDFNDYLDQYPLRGPWIDRREHFIRYKQKMYKRIKDKICFVPVSKWLKETLETSRVFQEGLNVKLIYNGVDEKLFLNYKRRDWKRPRVLFFNSNSSFKGTDVFMKAIDGFSIPCDLIIVGLPLEIKNTKNVLLSYKNKIFEQSELVQLFNEVDILIFPSKDESFGLLPAEAMLCGVFVICSKAGGLKEVVIDEEVGFCFENGNDEALRQKMEVAVNFLERTRVLGNKGRDWIISNYTLEKMMENYNEVYQSILKKA